MQLEEQDSEQQNRDDENGRRDDHEDVRLTWRGDEQRQVVGSGGVNGFAHGTPLATGRARTIAPSSEPNVWTTQVSRVLADLDQDAAVSPARRHELALQDAPAIAAAVAAICAVAVRIIAISVRIIAARRDAGADGGGT